MKTISIDSGFQRGGSLLRWDGEKFNRVQRAAENTWAGDGDSSFSIEVEEDFKGAVTRFWGVSSLSYANSAELLGFSNQELEAPSPVRGWASCQGSCVRSTDNWCIGTMGDYLIALARGVRIFTVKEALEKGEKHPSGNGNVLVRLNYEAGDQPADAYAVLDKEGNFLTEVSGCGDGTPYPVVTAEGWEFSSSFEDEARDRHEYDVVFRATADRMGLWERYDDLIWSKYSPENFQEMKKLSAQIEGRMRFESANQRADADKTGILRRLLKHYRNRQNPLRSLRKEKGGIWTFFREYPEAGPDTMVFHGEGWWVTWKK